MPQFKPEMTLAVTVTDFKKGVDWYTSVLGFQPLYLMEEMGWGELTSPVAGVNIGIGTAQDGGAPSGSAGATITFGVEDIDAVRAELESKGVQFDGPTYEVEGMVKLANFKDLDGNPLMLAQTLAMPA
jgi:CreA protein